MIQRIHRPCHSRTTRTSASSTASSLLLAANVDTPPTLQCSLLRLSLCQTTLAAFKTSSNVIPTVMALTQTLVLYSALSLFSLVPTNFLTDIFSLKYVGGCGRFPPCCILAYSAEGTFRNLLLQFTNLFILFPKGQWTKSTPLTGNWTPQAWKALQPPDRTGLSYQLFTYYMLAVHRSHPDNLACRHTTFQEVYTGRLLYNCTL